MQSVTDIMADIGVDIPAVRRVGVGGQGLIAADVLAALQTALPNVEWQDVENGLCDIQIGRAHV